MLGFVLALPAKVRFEPVGSEPGVGPPTEKLQFPALFHVLSTAPVQVPVPALTGIGLDTKSVTRAATEVRRIWGRLAAFITGN